MKNRSLLMIPGPVEFEPAVLAALGAPTTSHLAPNFIEAFGQALERMRQVFYCEAGQPFILAGSGTLGMDSAAANLVERGDDVLVVNTGYFGDRMGEILERYGANVTHLRAEPGERPESEQIEHALSERRYKAVFITHVDTSTGVLMDIKEAARLCKDAGALVVVDGVCSVGGEELKMDEWGVDVAFTASQKAIGVPPGLALLVVSERAMAAFRQRKTPAANYYADWANWKPVMEAYEARKPAYFGTPAVNLIFALNVSLGQILDEGMEARIARHKTLGNACKAAISALGLTQIAARPEAAAHTMTAPRFPKGVNGADFLAQTTRAGVVLAGGLHPKLRSEYFRIGHMGAVKLSDILGTIGAVEQAMTVCGCDFHKGAGVAAVMNSLM